MVKSATAFRTISEVSAELDVPQHVLRFWETKFPQIRPLKRGGGRRYYRPEDVELLRRIQSLLYKEGYTIKGVQRLLREPRGGAAAGVEEEGVHPPDEQAQPVHVEGAEAQELEHYEDLGDHDEHHEGMTTAQRDDIEAVLMELIALRDLLRSGRP
jgi:DNA-binding transcriptional MerR regulator